MRNFEAIVIGAGAAGGLASMILAEAGMKVLLLDAGRTRPFAAAPLSDLLAWIAPRITDPALVALLPGLIRRWGVYGLKALGYVRQPVQSKCFAWLMAPNAFIDDRDFPYTVADGAAFKWFRSHGLGGRMVAPGHGRQYHRLDAETFDQWPIAANDISSWYDSVESRLKAGDMAGVTDVEADTVLLLSDLLPDARLDLGSSAPPLDSVSRALGTGNVTHVGGAVAHCVEVDAADHVEGVVYADAATGELHRASAPLVFLCAGALESTRILLNSTSPRRTGGIGADSGVLGANLMDHLTVTAEGEGRGLTGDEPLTPGRCVMLPRLETPKGSVSFQVYRWGDRRRSLLNVVSFGEMRPRAENRVTLDPDVRDRTGGPVLRIACAHDDQERALGAVQAELVQAIADKMNVRITRISSGLEPPGTAIHECGTARMGSSSSNSVLDGFNQCWEAKGLYVTDGASFPTQGLQHPTLTIKALTARACAHALTRPTETRPSPSGAQAAAK